MYEAYIDRDYYMNRVCRTVKKPSKKMVVKKVLHPISMKHPQRFLVKPIGNPLASLDGIFYSDIEFRVDGNWISAKKLFKHRINELEALHYATR